VIVPSSWARANTPPLLVSILLSPSRVSPIPVKSDSSVAVVVLPERSMLMVPWEVKSWCAPVMPSDMNTDEPEGAVQVVNPVRVSETLVRIPSDGLNLSKGVLGNPALSGPPMVMVKSSVIVSAPAAMGV
jgi:hypothetical protein